MEEVELDKSESIDVLRHIKETYGKLLEEAEDPGNQVGMSKDEAAHFVEIIDFEAKLVKLLLDTASTTEYKPNVLFWFLFSYYSMRHEHTDQADAFLEGAMNALSSLSDEILKASGGDRVLKVKI